MNHLGEKLKELRISTGVSRKELAEAIGKSAKTIQNYELNLNTPNLQTLTKICKFFSLPMEYFTEQTEENIEQKESLENVPRGAMLIYNELVRLGFKEPDKLLDDETTQKLIDFIKENKDMLIEEVKKRR